MPSPSIPTPYRRHAGRGLAVAAAALLAVTSLTSCRADQVGTAAIVDGHSISVDELQDETASYLEALPSGNAGEAQHAILLQMIVSTLIQKAADSVGVTVSAGEVAAQRDQVLASVRAAARAAMVSARAYVSRQLAQSQYDPAAASEAISAAAAHTDVEVNRRYGRWDPQQGLAPLVSGGLSKTADQFADKS